MNGLGLRVHGLSSLRAQFLYSRLLGYGYYRACIGFEEQQPPLSLSLSAYLASHLSIYLSIYIYTHTYIHACMHACMHAYIPTFRNVHI